MGNEWQSWYGHRVGRGAWRAPRAFRPKVVPFRRRRGPGQSDGTLRTLILALLFVAVIAGVVFSWQPGPSDNGWSDGPIEWNEVQPVPRAPTDPNDAEWQDRGDDNYAPDTAPTPQPRASFGLCHSGGGSNCVVDGDTLWIGGQNVRLADIDAPETHEPRCAAEQALGDRATRRLHALVNGGAVTQSSIGRDQDGYGRKLRIVAVDGTSVGETLVGEGLARWYAGGRRSWCG